MFLKTVGCIRQFYYSALNNYVAADVENARGSIICNALTNFVAHFEKDSCFCRLYSSRLYPFCHNYFSQISLISQIVSALSALSARDYLFLCVKKTQNSC